MFKEGGGENETERGCLSISRSLAERVNHQYLPCLSMGSHHTFDFVMCLVTPFICNHETCAGRGAAGVQWGAPECLMRATLKTGPSGCQRSLLSVYTEPNGLPEKRKREGPLSNLQMKSSFIFYVREYLG